MSGITDADEKTLFDSQQLVQLHDHMLHRIEALETQPIAGDSGKASVQFKNQTGTFSKILYRLSEIESSLQGKLADFFL